MDWKHNARFSKCYPIVLAVEGGFLSDAKARQQGDKGGATNHGIAFNYNQGYLKAYGIIRPDEIQHLTREQALEIYFRKYWLPCQADELPDTKLALVYFDMVVNAGQYAADKLLSRLDSGLWHYEGDGKNVGYFASLTLQYMLRRLMYYFDCRNWGTFGAGWFNRLIRVSTALGRF